MNIIYENVSLSDLFIDERELWARLGGIGTVSDEKIKSAADEISAAATAAYAVKNLSVTVNNGSCICAGELTIAGESFAKIAGGCPTIMVIAATLGSGVDRLIRKKSAISIAEGFIYDAVASAMIESLVNLATVRNTSGTEHTNRFSPGYADMPLELQGEIISLLEAGKRMGITLGDSKLMSPSKTVTAFVGIK